METRAIYSAGQFNNALALFARHCPSDKLQRIVRWLLIEAAEVIESDGNWKLTVHGGPGKDIKTVIEKYANLE